MSHFIHFQLFHLFFHSSISWQNHLIQINTQISFLYIVLLILLLQPLFSHNQNTLLTFLFFLNISKNCGCCLFSLWLSRIVNSVHTVAGNVWMGTWVCWILGPKKEVHGFESYSKWIWRRHDSESGDSGVGLRWWEEQPVPEKWGFIVWLQQRWIIQLYGIQLYALIDMYNTVPTKCTILQEHDFTIKTLKLQHISTISDHLQGVHIY